MTTSLASAASKALSDLAEELERHGEIDAVLRDQGSSVRTVTEAWREAYAALVRLVGALPPEEAQRAHEHATSLVDVDQIPVETIRSWAAHWGAYALRTGEQRAGIEAHAEIARLDKALDKAMQQRDHYEERIGDTAAHVGCEQEWSNLHSHANCIEDAFDALTARTERAEAEIARLRALLDPVQKAARPIVNKLERGWFGNEEQLRDLVAAALATIADENPAHEGG